MTENPQFPLVHLALYSPRIAQNVGAAGRLCAATKTPLHVIRPIPFSFDDKTLKRTGMDYWELVDWTVHADFAAFQKAMENRRIWLFTTKAEQAHTDVSYRAGDVLLFGNEPHGVPDEVHSQIGAEHSVKIPIFEPRARSLNLATACAVAIYEAIRSIGPAS